MTNIQLYRFMFLFFIKIQYKDIKIEEVLLLTKDKVNIIDRYIWVNNEKVYLDDVTSNIMLSLVNSLFTNDQYLFINHSSQ